MAKVIKTGACLVFVLMMVVPGQSFAQITCQQQLNMYRADRVTPGLAQKAQDWYCPDPNAITLPVPRPKAQSSAGGGFPMGLPTTDAQAKVAIMGWMFQALLGGGSSADEQQQQALLQQKRAEEKMKAEMLERERVAHASEARSLWESQDAARSRDLAMMFGPPSDNQGDMSSPLLRKQAALQLPAKREESVREYVKESGADPEARREQDEYDNMNERWMQNQRHLIEQRLKEPNPYASKIYRSLRTNAPPPPTEKNYDNLQPGDVLLFSPDDTKSLLTNVGDILSSATPSPASHTVLYLKEVNGKKLFLDHTPERGSHVISEDEFLRTYGRRNATLASVAQPLKKDEADKLWDAARERIMKESLSQQAKGGNILDQTGYGLYGNDNMVCSEASRWALVKAGRDIPESASPLKKVLGIDYGPANFFSDRYNFIITPMGAPLGR